MSSRIICKTPGCGRTILEATAKKTNGFCMVCVKEKAQLERQEFIRKNVDPYAGVTDPVEIIQIMLRPRSHDLLIQWLPYQVSCEELYATLDSHQIAQLAAKAIELSKINDELARFLFHCGGMGDNSRRAREVSLQSDLLFPHSENARSFRADRSFSPRQLSLV